MEAVVVQLHTFLILAPDYFGRSTAQRLEAVEVQLQTYLTTKSRYCLAVNCKPYGDISCTEPHILKLSTR